ncbi:dihydrolipoyl dehydrogenase [Tropicimonas isoalkanivorans]|uniref:Dihydrolipoamide dehydrogenase n=1 Tax=Tropicimonas isoalkanivorans TaxID=441112 RepID=A0A1I1R3G9_9RHOB|nr:dihydrolipoyl dehydrogenase [Tropicimonas isoalkanivorans]SFD28931.1 dihydrolipoamide dehydrogenase [Tropicimonas isoalkanivorans]
MRELTCDVAVIGAGTAGLAAERRARKEGATTLLIDPHFAGTTCATVGCMPSKLLIAAADAARNAGDAEVFGIKAAPRIDGPQVMKRVQAERDRFVDAVCESIDDIPDDVRLTDRAHFTAPNRLALDGGDTIQASAVVIATGSTPFIPPPFRDLGDVLLTNETLFELQDLPRSVAVVGAGAIGLEMAQALAGLGVDVALFDQGTSLGGLSEEEVQTPLEAHLRDQMALHLGVEIDAERDGDRVRLHWGDQSRSFERVLMATGRPPALDGLGLDAAGLNLDDNGTPIFDPCTLQCGDAPVFIAGDANADRPLLHEASAEGGIAGRNAAHFPNVSRSHRKVPLAICFSRPEVALVGKRSGDGLISATCSWADQGRAKVEARNVGAAKIYAEADGTLAGAELCAPGGEHLALLIAWAVQSGMNVDQALDLPIYHPTVAEGLRPALQDLFQQCGCDTPWDREDDERPGC